MCKHLVWCVCVTLYVYNVYSVGGGLVGDSIWWRGIFFKKLLFCFGNTPPGVCVVQYITAIASSKLLAMY